MTYHSPHLLLAAGIVFSWGVVGFLRAVRCEALPAFPTFEHYLDFEWDIDPSFPVVHGGNFSIEANLWRFFFNADNTPPNEAGNGVRGEHAAGFHNVSLFGTHQVCVNWSHYAGGGNHEVSYFGVAANLHSIQRNTPDALWFLQNRAQSGADNFPQRLNCLNVSEASESHQLFGVGVGAQVSTSLRDQFLELKVWELFKVMLDGTTLKISIR
eukprot:gb/GECG01009909.1/.p1 GENE.gb/GECG01009909.1/~~gb/GECG01009909.1/.p1  ORF type:complete len:212 (+),score=15.41 gb/GECG01009909.1/:1-636(+)